ncbi:rifin, partial [Plasmodium reichenowi]
MKLHSSKILLFVIPLNILVTLYHVQNKNKPSITSHHTQTNRSLCECDTESSIYNSDEEINSVKEIFERQTSQRFEVYEERMKEKRQKRKEERDKNIQKIIQKDKMERSLAEKIEKGCLKCGCALGGGVLPVWGLVSGLWYATWTHYVAGIAAKAATKAGIAKAIEGLGNIYSLSELPYMDWIPKVTATNFFKPTDLVGIVNEVSNMCIDSNGAIRGIFCITEENVRSSPGLFVRSISEKVLGVAAEASNAAKSAEEAAITAENI